MAVKWGSGVVLALCLLLPVGCRTTQPNLKPEKTREMLVDPPQGEARFDSPGYPQQAYDKPYDPIRNAFDAKANVMPTRGSMMPTGGMGGRGGY
jgi:hypothetical protein